MVLFRFEVKVDDKRDFSRILRDLSTVVRHMNTKELDGLELRSPNGYVVGRMEAKEEQPVVVED